jgi:hypothetical protein
MFAFGKSNAKPLSSLCTPRLFANLITLCKSLFLHNHVYFNLILSFDNLCDDGKFMHLC